MGNTPVQNHLRRCPLAQRKAAEYIPERLASREHGDSDTGGCLCRRPQEAGTGQGTYLLVTLLYFLLNISTIYTFYLLKKLDDTKINLAMYMDQTT